jgi:hypothetical protein
VYGLVESTCSCANSHKAGHDFLHTGCITNPTITRAGITTMLLLTLFLVSFLSSSTSAALYYPDPSTSLLEHILVSNWGAYSSNFSTAITPCTNYVSQTGSIGANSGRTTAAQWMRVLFHDFVTANVSAGTGGIDASIGFETARAENSGSAFNDSFAFWKAWVSEGVSSE